MCRITQEDDKPNPYWPLLQIRLRFDKVHHSQNHDDKNGVNSSVLIDANDTYTFM